MSTLKHNENDLINIKQFILLLKSNWYWFALSLFICLFFTFLINRYSHELFLSKTTLLVQSDNNINNPVSEILYGGDEFSSRKSLNDQILIMRSYPLIYKTIVELGYDINYFVQGEIKTVETYNWRPIDFIPLNDIKSYGLEMTIKVLNNKEFEVIDSEQIKKGRFLFDKEFNYNKSKFTIRFNDSFVLSHNEKFPVIVIKWKNPHNIAKSYQNKLIVKKIKPDAAIIEASVKGQDISKDVTFLNKLTELYIAQNLNNKNRASSNTISFIDKQLKETRDSLAFIENRLQGFKKENTVVSISVDAQRFYQEISALEKEKASVLIQEKYYNYLTNYLSENENYEQIVVPISYGISDDLLNNMISELVKLQMKLNILDPNGVLKNSAIIESHKQIVELKESIKESVKNQSEANLILLKDIEARMILLENSLSSLPQMERELVNIERLYRLSENIYLFLMQKRAEAGITGAANISDIRVLELAFSESSSLVSPNRYRNYLVGIVLALLLPIIIFTLIEILNDKINSRADIEKLSNIPFLGIIGKNYSGHELVVNKQPKSSISEGFRSIRSNLDFVFKNNSNKEGKIITLTSSVSGEGKTFCTKNLASIYAMSGKKTLVIGADMRKPKIYIDFEKENKKGLSTYSIGNNSLNDIINKTDIDNLFIITSGPIPPNPGELLSRNLLNKMFSELKTKFDYIIIDSPPIGLVSDAMIIMEKSDFNIYVVRQGYTHQSFLNYINHFYDSEKLQNIAILLNESNVSGVYGYGYGYSYGYGGYYGQDKKYLNNEYYDEDII